MTGRVPAPGALAPRAGVYELTPLKRHFRRRCREGAGSGPAFGVCCVGSSVGLMAMLVVLGLMSVGWMAVIAAVITAHKILLPGPPSVRRSHARSSHSGF